MTDYIIYVRDGENKICSERLMELLGFNFENGAWVNEYSNAYKLKEVVQAFEELGYDNWVIEDEWLGKKRRWETYEAWYAYCDED